MANFDQDTQRKTGFFHSLGLVITKDVNDPANEIYKSAHNVRTSEVWANSINYSSDFTNASSEASTNPAVTQVGTDVSTPTSLALLYPLKDSNGQAWFLDTGSPTWDSTGFIPSSGWVKPMISPVDVTDASGAPSNGFQFKLYRPDGNPIPALNGRWEVDYYASIIKFNVGATPFDSDNGLGFDIDFASLVSAPNQEVYLQSNGPRGISFQYTGEFLDSFLDNLPQGGSGGVNGSGEWQDSVKGYLITVGTDTTVNGLTGTNDQVNYLNNTYDDYYIKTTTVGVGNSYSIADDTWYRWNGSTFSIDNPVTTDDDNRYLKLENDIVLDTFTVVGTGSSYSLNLNTTVSNNNIIEYVGTSSTGLTQSAWSVTPPRTGMVTTIDDIFNRRTRYTGVSNGWVEALDEYTFKVNTQKNIVCNLTSEIYDYDVAIDDLLQFEPSGDKSVDILINGLEVISDSYDFANPSSMTSISSYLIVGSNSLQISNAEAPTTSEYLRLDNGTSYNYRKVVGVTPSGAFSTVTYGGYDVPSITSLDKFNVTLRNGTAKQGDILLWVGSNLYELDNDDLMTLEYTTPDRSAENL